MKENGRAARLRIDCTVEPRDRLPDYGVVLGDLPIVVAVRALGAFAPLKSDTPRYPSRLDAA